MQTSGITTVEDWLDEDFVSVVKMVVLLMNE